VISPYLTRPIPELPAPVAKDPQRAALYRMEREFVGVSVNHSVPRSALQEISKHACKYYRIKPVKVVIFNQPGNRTFGETVSYSYNDGTPDFGYVIRLNRGFHGANVCTLLHELAHYIVEGTYIGAQDHGKKFVGVYMHLLDKYRIIPSDAFRVIAKRHKICIAGKFRPATIRS